MLLKERLTPLKKFNFSKDIFCPTPNTAIHCIFYHTRIHLISALGDVHCKQKPCPVNADVRSLMRPCLLRTMPHKNNCKAFFFPNWLPVRRISPFKCRFLPGVVPYCLTLSEKRLCAREGCDTPLHLDEAFAFKFICHSHRRDPNAEDKTLITGSQGPKWQLRKTAEPSGDIIEAVALCLDLTHFLAFEEDKFTAPVHSSKCPDTWAQHTDTDVPKH